MNEESFQKDRKEKGTRSYQVRELGKVYNCSLPLFSYLESKDNNTQPSMNVKFLPPVLPFFLFPYHQTGPTVNHDDHLMGGEGHRGCIPYLQGLQMETVVSPKGRFPLSR